MIVICTICNVQHSVAQPITLQKLLDLNFGTIIAGTNALVNHTDPTAAKFRVRYSKNAALQVTFSLPTNLSTASSNLMPVAFPAGAAAWADKDQLTGRTTFNPQTGTSFTMPKDKDIYLWLGGSLSPPSSQQAGTYSAVVTIIVTVL
ncbi:MAG: DUF4402 domain-containing protein [bacterium]